MPGNLLFQGGRLSGVIDWAGLGVGDPACDMIVAWGLLPPSARNAFRGALGVDDATWARSRGWALSIGLIALPYYKDTNPEFAATARHLIRQVLADHESDSMQRLRSCGRRPTLGRGRIRGTRTDFIAQRAGFVKER
jgi:aminoglycoside phosphotransferase (APT) family kinase protein